MAAARTFNIRFIDIDGEEISKTVTTGDLVNSLVDTTANVAILNGEEVAGDVQLRSGDVLEEGRRVGKAG